VTLVPGLRIARTASHWLPCLPTGLRAEISDPRATDVERVTNLQYVERPFGPNHI
jgi:hypothetical protein